MTARNGRYGALDIGTVTCRLLVADVRDGSVEEVAKEYAITDLGEGVDATGRLSEAAMGRVARTIDGYLEVLRGASTLDHPVSGLVAVATSAARDASNAEEFRDLLRLRGIALTVISGQKEAGLTFAGASSDFPGENLLVVDIGGGSTELIAGRAGHGPVASHSFNIGCRRVTDRFFRSDPPAPVALDEARQWVRDEMRQYFDDLAEGGFAIDRLVAVAGTATSVVSIRESMETYDSARVHKAVVTADQLRAIEEKLASETVEQRRLTVGLDPKRAGVIVAGFVILEEVLKLAGTDRYTVSEADILKGLILEAASRSE